MHVARPIPECHDGRVLRLAAMAQHGYQLAIVTMDREHRLPGAVQGLDGGRVVVEAAQPGVGVAFDE
jgi:hypothetical protein